MNKTYRVGRYYKPKGFFGTWLVENLIANGYTYGDLVEQLDMDRTALSRYVTMRSHPSYRITKQFCIFFHEPNTEAVYSKVLDDIESEKMIPEYRQHDIRRFNGWLIDELAKRNLTGSAFAKEIGIPDPTIRKHMLEKRYPCMRLVKRYATYFNVDVTDILDRILYSKQYHKRKGTEHASSEI